MYGDLPVGCGIARIQHLIARGGDVNSYKDFLEKPEQRDQPSRHIFSGDHDCRTDSLKTIFDLEIDKSEKQFTQVHILRMDTEITLFSNHI